MNKGKAMDEYEQMRRDARHFRDEQFRRVVREGLPVDLLCERLGLTESQVTARAKRLGVSLARAEEYR